MNQLEKTKKLMVGITSTALMLGIAGCGVSTPEQMTEEEWDAFTDANQSSSGSYSGSSSGTSSSYNSSSSGTSSSYVNEDIPPVPEDQSCVEWEWDLDDGVWECEDDGSSYYGHYYYGGRYYSSKPDLYKSTEYINYKNSSTFKGKGTTVNTSDGTSTISNAGSDGSKVRGNSGFGSGSNSFGG